MGVGQASDIETDLRAGLARAAAAGRFDVVQILSDQLKAHLERTAGNVISLGRGPKREHGS